jgi:YD repeat-containing protein
LRLQLPKVTYIQNIPITMKTYFLNLKFYLLFLVAFCYSMQCAKPQSIGQIASPNAASFAVFAQYPQSSFTGSPAINIPVYDFNYEGVSLPISLRYSTNTVKPYNDPSWVGLGWNLMAGGLVNRVVNGKPDDENWYGMYDYNHTRETNMGFFYDTDRLSGATWNNAFDIHHFMGEAMNLNNWPTRYDWWGNTTTTISPEFYTIKDYSPDEFSFSVGSLSGKFYMDNSGNWKVKSIPMVKILKPTNDDYATLAVPPYYSPITGYTMTFPERRYLNKITFVDDKGITYVFGGNVNANEVVYSSSFDWFVKTWNLTSIKLPNGKQITFTYESAPGYLSVDQPIMYNPVYGGGIVKSNQRTKLSYLTKIHTDLHDIDFIRSGNTNNLAKLDAIKVNYLPNNTRQKYFTFSFQNTPNDRLKLYSFVERDRNNRVSSQYFFQYNARKFLPTSKNTDHWGFYNTKPLSPTDPYGSREPDTLNSRSELLHRVIYPTGGSTIYTWEPHSYSKAIDADDRTLLNTLTNNKYAGGVRIKQITNYDENNARIGDKKYLYTNGSMSSGILHGVPRYVITLSEFGLPIFAINSKTPLTDNNFGAHVTYTNTTEINEDGSSLNTIYSNFDTPGGEYMDEPAAGQNFSSSNVENWNLKFISNDHERGVPLSETLYAADNQTPVSQKTYTYTRINKATEFIKSYQMGFFNIMPNQVRAYTEYAVKFYTNAYLPATITEKLYNGIHPIVTATTFTYDPITLNKKTITKTNSNGDILTIKYRYINDLVAGLSVPATPAVAVYPYSYMFKNNMIGIPLETIQSTSKGGVETITNVTMTTYQGLLGATGTAVPSTIYKTQIINPKTAYTNHTITIDGSGDHEGTMDTDLKPITNFSKWDNASGKLLQFENLGKSPISYLWGYSKTQTIAECKNAAYNEFFYEGFEDYAATAPNIEPYGGHTGTNCKPFPYTVTWTPPAGRTYVISYWYRNEGWKYKEEQVYTPNFQLTGGDAFDDIRVYPVDAQMVTYTYNPAVGLSSITDARSQTTYYNYDTYNRLRTVKDANGKILKAYCYNYKNEPSPCATPQLPAGPAIYVKVRISNIGYGTIDTDPNDNLYEYMERGDVKAHFYSDEACTIPYTLPSPLYLEYKVRADYHDDIYGNSTYSWDNSVSAPAGVSSFLIRPSNEVYHSVTYYLSEDEPGVYVPHNYGYDYNYIITPGPTATFIVK